MILAAWIAGAVVMRLACGKSLRLLRSYSSTPAWMIGTALLVQMIVRSPSVERLLPPTALAAAWAGGAIGLAGALTTLRHVPGAWATVLGTLSNALVVLINSGMPVVLNSGRSVCRGLYHSASSKDHLVVLCDVLPLGNNLLSLGDLLLLVGIACMVVAADELRSSAPSAGGSDVN